MSTLDVVSESFSQPDFCETGNNNGDGANCSVNERGSNNVSRKRKFRPSVVLPNAPIQLTPYQRFIALSRYARYLPEEQRRETWEETVARYVNFMAKIHPEFPTQRIYDAIVNMRVMPSMRALMTAGRALEIDNVAGYNCAYVAVDHPFVFDEAMYILMCGCGLGFSVERQYIKDLPDVAERFAKSDTRIIVEDSRIGWAESLRELIGLLYGGRIPSWDLSRLRQKGAPLKTFGGRSSGPEPLNQLFKFCVSMFMNASGRKLTSIECHDLMCKIGDVVVSGGVRRSALISLSNLSDQRMAKAKSGQWWETEPHRALANNSVAYTEKPEVSAFLAEWTNLYESKAGERGIFSRFGAQKKVASLARGRKADYEFGTNPCGEILLRSAQFCNLTEVVIREDDTPEMIKEKVEIAALLGTFQSTLTNFRYLRKIWRKNVEEERLLGVSLTGIQDNPLTNGSLGSDALIAALEEWKAHAVEVNAAWAEKLEIPASAAITTVKPSGTVSQLVDAASGIHGRFSKYYIRTVRNDKTDPLSDFMIECGIPHEEDVTKNTTWVFSFPVKSPEHAVVASEMSAIQQLDNYLLYARHWAEHSVSVTIYVREHEWFKVLAWVYEHFNEINGITFLPYSDHVYMQAPYQEISDLEYGTFCESFPNVDFTTYQKNEFEDHTQGAKQLACAGNLCEIV